MNPRFSSKRARTSGTPRVSSWASRTAWVASVDPLSLTQTSSVPGGLAATSAAMERSARSSSAARP